MAGACLAARGYGGARCWRSKQREVCWVLNVESLLIKMGCIMWYFKHSVGALLVGDLIWRRSFRPYCNTEVARV